MRVAEKGTCTGAGRGMKVLSRGTRASLKRLGGVVILGGAGVSAAGLSPSVAPSLPIDRLGGLYRKVIGGEPIQEQN